MPVVIDDGTLARSLNVRVTPTHVLIGRDGRVAHVEHLEDARFHAALNRVLQDKRTASSDAATAPVAVTRGFGVGDVVPGLPATTSKVQRIDLGASSKPRTALPLSLDPDGSVFAACGAREIPSVVLIDRAGRIAQVLGPEDRGLGEAVQAVLAER